MSKTRTAKGKRKKRSEDGASIDPRLMKALSHPLRQQILQELNQRVASPAELSQVLGESLGNVSYHVKILAELEAIELVRTAPVRGALEHFYRPLVRSYLTADDWAGIPPSIRSALSGNTVQRLSDHLASADEDQADSLASLLELDLDEQGVQELNAEVAGLLERASEIQEASAERLASSGDDDAESRRMELAVLHFHRGAARRAKKRSAKKS